MLTSMHRADQLLRWWGVAEGPRFVEWREQIAKTIDAAVEDELRRSVQETVDLKSQGGVYDHPMYVLLIPRTLVGAMLRDIKFCVATHGAEDGAWLHGELGEWFEKWIEAATHDDLYPP